MSLESGKTYGNIVDVVSSEKPPARRVAPGDANASYLVDKVLGAAGISGGRMPKDGPPYLTLAQIDSIKDWIAAGANNN